MAIIRSLFNHRKKKMTEALHVLRIMDIPVDCCTYHHLLQACIGNKALSDGKLIHAHINQTGFLEDKFLQNTLVNMYVKCGNLVDARRVFDQMPVRDAFSWTVMISAYARHDFPEEALNLFHRMRRTGIQPNQFTFASVLPVCASLASLEKGMEIHERVVCGGFESDVVVGNALINMYAKCGNVEKARELFDKMRRRDVVSWNSIIAGYAQNGLLDEALPLFEEMPQRDIASWNTIIAGYVQGGVLDEALKLFKEMPQRDVVSWTTMIAGYAKKGLVDEALKLFEEMPQRNLVSWNAMIAGFVHNGYAVEALKLFRQMQLAGVRPDSTTFACILSACANLASLEEGIEIHKNIVKTGFQLNIIVKNALVGMYMRCGSIEKALQLFDEIHQPDDISWTVMIAGYAHNGLVDEALKLFIEMPQPNLVSWNAMLAGFVQNGYAEDALNLFRQMLVAGMEPDSTTFVCILTACASLVGLEHGMEIHQKIIGNGFQMDIFIMTALVNMYAQCGSISKAQEVFQRIHHQDLFSWNVMLTGYIQNGLVGEALKLFTEMPERNMVSWNAMIGGFFQNGHDEEALKLFQKMQLVGMKPDSKTFVTILPVCANLAALKQGQEIHGKVIRSRFQFDVVVENSLIHMYAKCGSIERAHELFDRMHDRDVVSWNAMIAGYAMHGCGKEAFKLFEQLKHSGMNPNSVTFVSVLSVCNHAGLVDEAYQYFHSMRENYYITPSMEHYICMVDLLGRVGLLYEAQEFINKMPIEPSSVIWSCLLGACRLHNNIELGECIAECLFELDPKNAAPYVLLSNIYAAAGSWNNAENVRKMMKDRGIRKTPGCSWLEVNKQVHAFLIEDISNSQTGKYIYKVGRSLAK